VKYFVEPLYRSIPVIVCNSDFLSFVFTTMPFFVVNSLS
jgi:hypothetical protein